MLKLLIYGWLLPVHIKLLYLNPFILINNAKSAAIPKILLSTFFSQQNGKKKKIKTDIQSFFLTHNQSVLLKMAYLLSVLRQINLCEISGGPLEK